MGAACEQPIKNIVEIRFFTKTAQYDKIRLTKSSLTFII